MKKVISAVLAALMIAAVPFYSSAEEIDENIAPVQDVEASGAVMENEESQAAKIIGDADEDNDITANDSLIILRASVGLADIATRVGDADGDNYVTSGDSLMVLRYSIKFRDGNLVGLPVDTEIIQPTSISLDKTTLNINSDSSATLKATVSPSNATLQTVSWTSSNYNVATVSNGTVKGVSGGTAVITAKTVNGKTATCTVNVKQVEVLPTSVKLNKSSLSLNVGATSKLTATIAPTNATNKNVTWTSSNNSVAIVLSDGTVRAIKTGTSTITAKTSNGKTATCKVTVTSTVKGSCNVVKEYLKNNATNTDKKTFYEKRLEISGYYYTLGYDAEKDRLYYALKNFKNNEEMNKMDMPVMIYFDYDFNGDRMYESHSHTEHKGTSRELYAYGRVDFRASTYTRGTVYKYAYDAMNTNIINANEVFSSDRDDTLDSMNIFLKTYIGVNINDIGLKKFK